MQTDPVDKMVGFNIEFAEDPIKGNPASARLWRKWQQCERFLSRSWEWSPEGHLRSECAYDESGNPICPARPEAANSGKEQGETGPGIPRTAETRDTETRDTETPDTENGSVVSVFDSEGAMMYQLEMKGTAGHRECTVSLPDRPNLATYLERVNAVDEKGNWTHKTKLLRTEAYGADAQPIEEIWREIKYY